MPLDVGDVIDVLSQLADNANLRVTVKESIKSGLIAGTATTLGGIFGGPAGIAVGGTVGVAAATYFAQGKFQSVSAVLNKMTHAEKKALYDKAMTIIQGVGIEDMALVAKLALGNTQLRDELLGVVIDHVSGQMKMQIVD